jgi:glycosyltransferase involved in cell wall biosynthesis
MVVMEALFHGIPVIATPEAGPLSILTNKKLGICLPLDVEKWINKILYYLNHRNIDNSVFRTEIIKKNCNWNIIAEKYHKIINEYAYSSNQ